MLRDLTRNPSKENFYFSHCNVFKGRQRHLPRSCLYRHVRVNVLFSFNTPVSVSRKLYQFWTRCFCPRIKMSEEELKLRIDTTCKAAEEFTKLYFESFDLKRHLMNKFYMNDATLSWDGNPAIGKDAIQKFLDELPQTSHTLTALDAQPVFLEAVKGEHAALVQVGGFVTFIKEKDTKGFSQSFLITAQDNKWKIVNDSFRIQLPINCKGKG